MQEALRTLPHRAAAAIALLILAAAAACADSIPAVQPPAVDSAPLEDAAERLQAAAERLEELEETVARASPESNAIIINKDALRLLALLSQLQIELGIIDALINPPPDIRPSRWPLEPEDGAALGFASTRLFWIHHQLPTFAASPTESLPILQDEETLILLAELQGELQIIGRSTYAFWKAHEAGEPAAPAIPPLTLERTDIYQPQTRLDRLIEAVGAFLATNGAGAAAIPGATWNAVNALERLDWAVRGNCFAWDCHGGSDFGDRIDFRERVLAVYSAAEFRRASAEAWGYSGAAFDDAHCRRSVQDARSALSTASFTWSQYASRFRDVDFTPRDAGLSPWPHSILSPSSLYRRLLLACTLQVAISDRDDLESG